MLRKRTLRRGKRLASLRTGVPVVVVLWISWNPRNPSKSMKINENQCKINENHVSEKNASWFSDFKCESIPEIDSKMYHTTALSGPGDACMTMPERAPMRHLAAYEYSSQDANNWKPWFDIFPNQRFCCRASHAEKISRCIIIFGRSSQFIFSTQKSQIL